MEKIVILDFGSQYTQIIARKIRELNVYAEIYPFSIDIDTIKSIAPNGIILSGGPSSVYTENAPIPKFDVFSLGVPVLGICYGLQLIAYQLGGEVNKAAKREYGRANLIIDKPDVIFDGVSQSSQVWMSHGDSLTKIPDGFEIIAHTENAPIAAIRNQVKKIYGVQFHPEVHHSVEGIKILENFVRKICLCKEIWDMHSFVGSAIKKIQEEVGNSEVICALSGGVDSTVLAVLLSKAIGNKLHCIHIDTGLMRLQESEKLMKLFNDNFNISIDLVNASDIFLSRLKGVTDPELKRKIIGNTFIELFEIEAKKFNNAKWLAQGTLYPDVIESVSVKGPSAVIKSHHNVGGLPEKMGLKLIEPFRELFKDEVRAVGRQLGVPEWFIRRHPFPGPGLAIRIIGEITQERIEILQKADDIYIQEITEAGLYDKIWQAFAVLLPVQSVGVMGDERTY
ncbi:MAG TPA: glutamine-hydrolyzing GMP synthase, partial [Candidatus Kapabacteria bacterium]|nr:glutamine-hydrolyzing GMP synthase [Candidatus Kapabacteria bacterium]